MTKEELIFLNMLKNFESEFCSPQQKKERNILLEKIRQEEARKKMFSLKKGKPMKKLKKFNYKGIKK